MAEILHVVPGLDVPGNGISVAARILASKQGARVCEARTFKRDLLQGVEEVWVHSVWTPMTIRSCHITLSEQKRLVRMPHGNLDPVRLSYHAWRKRLAGFIERPLLRRTNRIIATCEAERSWIRAYLGNRCPPIEIVDLKRFFCLPSCTTNVSCLSSEVNRPLHLLYLGRRHPLKGLECLEAAVADIIHDHRSYGVECTASPIELRIVSNAFGDEKERVWEWCDVLVLPTLSENFGLVVAEALERGKRVITTDGAPAWDDGNDYGGRMEYLKGYRDGTQAHRIELLKKAICGMSTEQNSKSSERKG